MKPKIMIISSVHRWNDPRILYKQAVSLAKEYDVELHVQADFAVKEVDGVKIIGLPPKRRIARPLNWWRLLVRGLRSKAAVVHFHDSELLAVALLLKIFGRKKVIYDVHEDLPAAIYSREWIKYRHFFSKLADKVEKWLAGKMTALVFAESYYKDNFAQVDVKKEDILNYPVFSGWERRQAPNDCFNLVYAGGITEIRGALIMVEAVGLLEEAAQKQTKLYLVGDIDPQLMLRIQDIAAKYRISEQIICPGRVSLQEVYYYYRNSHLGLAVLHPEKNYIKSLATKIFEYMSVGIPVVASNFPLWTELVTGNECGLTADPLDPQDVAQKITRLLSNPEMMEQMGANGYGAFMQKYNWDVEEQKLFKMYRQILNVDGGGKA